MKRLYRSETDKKVAGICGGLAEYWEMDPTIVRLLVIILALCTGGAPVVTGYVLTWWIMPVRKQNPIAS